MKKKKGITLTELIIALALMSMVAVLVFFFFSVNRKKINEVNIETELQSESEMCMKYLSKYAMEASKATVEESSNAYKIIFSRILDNGNVIPNGAIFILNKDSKELFMKKTDDGSNYDNTFICKDIDEISAKCDSSEINLNISFSNNGIDYGISNSFVYRNSDVK